MKSVARLGRRALAALALVLLLTLAAAPPARAQGAFIYQNGLATPNHVPKFLTQGRIGDAGGLNGDLNGNGLAPFSVTDGSLPGNVANVPGLGQCFNSDLTAGPIGAWNAMCFGHDANGNGLITLDSYGGLATKTMYLRKNGVSYEFPFDVGGVTGPSTSRVGALACFNNLVGNLFAQDCPTASILGNYTSALTTPGALLTATSQSGITSSSIYGMAFPGATTFDGVRSVVLVPGGTTMTGTNGFGSYIDNEAASIGPGDSGNVVNSFGVGVAGVSGAWSWGANYLLTDSKTQSATTNTGIVLAGEELDFNIWGAATLVNGIQLVGASGVQPFANGFVANVLDISGAQRARWSSAFISPTGAAFNGLILGEQSLYLGSASNSQTIGFDAFNSIGGVVSADFQNTATGFNFTHANATPYYWAFDAPLELPSGIAIAMNFDNAVDSDSSHHVSFGAGPSIATILVGNGTAPIEMLGPVSFAGGTTSGTAAQTFTNSPCTASLTAEEWIPVKLAAAGGTWYLPVCQ